MVTRTRFKTYKEFIERVSIQREYLLLITPLNDYAKRIFKYETLSNDSIYTTFLDYSKKRQKDEDIIKKHTDASFSFTDNLDYNKDYKVEIIKVTEFNN